MLCGSGNAEIDQHSREIPMRRMSDTCRLSDIKGRAPGVKRRDGCGNTGTYVDFAPLSERHHLLPLGAIELRT